MTIYYICRVADLTDLELLQTADERLACEIVIAASIYDELNMDLVAVEADSENGTYAQLKGAVMYSMELTEENIEIWKKEGIKIYKYLLGPAEDNSRLWGAFGMLDAAMDDYESNCEQSDHFNSLGRGFADAVTTQFDENIREEQSDFASIMQDLYEIEEIKTVTS